MGKGLSPLQKDVLAVLEEFPALEDQPPGSLKLWVSPKQILAALHRPPTASNRTAISKTLRRLEERGLVATATAEIRLQGSGYRYVRIKNPTRQTLA